MHGEPLSAEEMDALAKSATPLLRLRGNWTVVDPAIARKARKRLVRTVKPAEAVAAALTGTVQVADVQEQVVVGASLLKVRDRLLSAATRDQVEPPAALRATLRDSQLLHGLTWLAEMTSLGLGACLADDMGLGKTVTLIALHLHRHERGAAGPTLVVCPASLLGNWEDEVHRFAPGVPVVRFHGSARDLSAAGDGFVLTTYGTMRRDAETLGKAAWDLVVADEAQHVKNPRTSTARALRSLESAARVALTGTPVENNLTELWAILDWTTPGLLGSRNAFRKAWAAPIESGLEPTKARQFADLIGPFLLRRDSGADAPAFTFAQGFTPLTPQTVNPAIVQWRIQDPNQDTPVVQQFSFGPEFQFAASMVGPLNTSATARATDAGCATSTKASSPVHTVTYPYAQYGYGNAFLEQIVTNGRADYDALQLRMQRRMSDGLSYTVAYTWSQALGDFLDHSERGRRRHWQLPRLRLCDGPGLRAARVRHPASARDELHLRTADRRGPYLPARRRPRRDRARVVRSTAS